MKITFDKIKKNPNGFGWVTSDDRHWDYKRNAIGRQRWLNLNKWLEAVKVCDTPQRLGTDAVFQLTRAMVVCGK